MEPLLKIQNLKKHFSVPGKGMLHAVDDVSFDIMPNETLGLVGESGCGKSTIGNVLMRLLPATSGQVWFNGKDLLSLKPKQLHEERRNMQMIFQDPYSSLNPRKSIQSSLLDALEIYKVESSKQKRLERVQEIASMVGLEPYVLKQFPYELDGGKRQMVGIARALLLDPCFIVCDEPVSSLDVSVQSTILNLLIDMQAKRGLSYLFISHDLSVVRHISNRVAVMYLGQMIELAETDELFTNTLHPYSIALLSAVPTVDFQSKTKRIVLTGDVPSPLNPGTGCRFAPRCWMACEKCFQEDPHLEEAAPGHMVACHYWREAQKHAQMTTSKEIPQKSLD